MPGAVYIEMALAAAKATYGSTDYSVDNLALRRALILDETCDPVLGTTLNRDTGTLEFAAFTATTGGDVKWTITATAELNTLSRSPDRAKTPRHAKPVTTIDRDEFYTAPKPSGSHTVTHSRRSPVSRPETVGRTAEIITPAQIADEIDQYRFHPALIDGAFQTLIGTTLLGHEADEDAYLPTRIRQSAIYRAPEQHMTAQISRGVGDQGRDRKRHHTHRRRRSRRWPYSPVSPAIPERFISHVARTGRQRDCTRFNGSSTPRSSTIRLRHSDSPDSLSWLVFLDEDRHRDNGRRPIASLRPPRAGGPTSTRHRADEVDGGYALNPQRPEQLTS